MNIGATVVTSRSEMIRGLVRVTRSASRDGVRRSPPLGASTPDEVCGPQIRFDGARREIRYAMNNSFGFGGNNCSLLFGRVAA